MPLFEQAVRAWKQWLQLTLSSNEKAYSGMSGMTALAQRIGTRRCYDVLNEMVRTVEANAEQLRFSTSARKSAHSTLANLAISSSNDVDEALRHLEIILKIQDEEGKKRGDEDPRQDWPKKW